MFKIRAAQWEPFAQESAADFERRMIERAYKFFPDECAEMGNAQVREMIQYGMKRAKHYEIRTERGICSYVDVMFGHGKDFDRDPSLPWAAEMLSDQDFSPDDRAERIFDAAFPIAEENETLDAAEENEDHEHDEDEDDNLEDEGPDSDPEPAPDEEAMTQELQEMFQQLDEVLGNE